MCGSLRSGERCRSEDRRSQPGGAISPGRDCADRGAMREFGVLPFRSAVALRCRSETGAPLSRALWAGWRYAAFAALRAAVPAPTGRTGRRSAFPDGRCHLCWWGLRREGCYAGVRGSSLSQRCRAAMPVGDRRSVSRALRAGWLCAAIPVGLSGRRRGGGAFGLCRRGCGESFPRRRSRGGACSGPGVLCSG